MKLIERSSVNCRPTGACPSRNSRKWWASRKPRPDIDFYADLVYGDARAVSWSPVGGWLVSYPQSTGDGVDTAAVLREQERALANIAAVSEKPLLLNLSVTLRRPGSRGGAPGRSRAGHGVGDAAPVRGRGR